MTTVISFVNQKGGVGKTTSVINTAAALAKSDPIQTQNKRILVIDMDPQGNSSQLFTNITDDEPSIYDLLMCHSENLKSSEYESNIQKVIYPTYLNNLDIIPANVLLSSAELDLVNAHGRESILKRLLRANKALLKDYAYIIIDCQPSLGLLTINSIIASDYITVPLKADVFSLKGLELLNETVSKLQKVFEIDSTILGLFFTQVSPSEDMFKESFSLCKENYGELVFESFIRTNIHIDQANAMDQSIIDFKSDSSSATDYINLAKEILVRTEKQ